MFERILGNEQNPLLRYGFAALLFFGPLYLIASYTRSQWPVLVAAIALLTIFLAHARRNGARL